MHLRIFSVRDYDPDGYYAHVVDRRGRMMHTTTTKATEPEALRAARIWVQVHYPEVKDIRVWGKDK